MVNLGDDRILVLKVVLQIVFSNSVLAHYFEGVVKLRNVVLNFKNCFHLPLRNFVDVRKVLQLWLILSKMKPLRHKLPQVRLNQRDEIVFNESKKSDLLCCDGRHAPLLILKDCLLLKVLALLKREHLFVVLEEVNGAFLNDVQLGPYRVLVAYCFISLVLLLLKSLGYPF